MLNNVLNKILNIDEEKLSKLNKIMQGMIGDHDLKLKKTLKRLEKAGYS